MLYEITHKSSIQVAYTTSIFKSLIYAFALLVIKNLLDNISLFDLLSQRFLLSAITMIFLRRIGIIKVNLKGKNITVLIFVSMLQPIIYFIFESLGIKYTTTVMAGMIFSLIPLVVLAAERVILKEKSNGKQWFSISLVIIGAMVCTIMSTTSKGGKSQWIGIIFIVIALISDGLYFIFSRKASRSFTSSEITYVMAIMGAVVFNAINILIHLHNNTIIRYFEPLYAPENLIAFAYLGIVCSIVAIGLQNYILSKIQASIVSSLTGFYTIFAIIIGVVFNGESLKFYHVIGALLIILGGIGVNYYKNRTNVTKNTIQG